jgi:hypothetical protein
MAHGNNEATINRKMKRVISGMGLSKCPLAALLIVSAICTLYIALAGAKASKPKTVWAKQIYDVHCRLRPNKYEWKACEIPKFKAYVPGPGNDDLWLVTVVSQGCQLQIDGIWYRYTGPEWTGALGNHDQTHWLAKVGGYLTVSLDERYWKSIKDSKPLKLKPGKHTVRLGWAGYKADATGKSEREDNPILLLSNTVRIEMLPAAGAADETPHRNEHRQRVIDLFDSYMQKETIAEAEEKAGIKTDLRSFHFWQPKFTWVDIPILLELAERGRIMTGHIPSLSISSYIQRQCREGMVALWLIEGLRRKQTALVRQKQTGEEPRPRTYYHLPLNPICRKGLPDDYANLVACEKSPQVHQETLEAYQEWWRMVCSLPPSEGAVFYPLDLTGLRWFGVGHHQDPLEIYEKMNSTGTIAQRTIRTGKYTGSNYVISYEPGQVLQTVYYTLDDPIAPGPFTKEMLAVQKVVLHFYDEDDREIRTKSIVPLSGQP